VILTVDVGNTSTVCGIFEESGCLKALFSFKTEPVVSPEELTLRLKGFLDLYGIKLWHIKGLSVSCVVPPLLNWWTEVGKKWLVREVLIADADTVGIPVKLRYPSEVGADRLVNAFAGWKKFGGPLIIVDFGTAITFDCVSKDGEYLGGAIAPGLGISVDSLFKYTAKLPKIDLGSPPEGAIGKDTVSAIKSGVIYGFAGLTDRLVELLSAEMEATPSVIATGGLANLVAPFSRTIKKLEPYLTLEGLYLLWKASKG